MATDYKKIKEENSKNPPINYRNIFTPYSDKTHFVYELVQNADDNISRCVGLQLCESGLLVWNDGCQFSEEDVRSICAIGFSNKDLTQIGTFGMGFKAVYTYTDIPEVYSGDERFRIPIKNPTIPEGIDIDDIDVRVVEQLDKGRTVFWLPFREKMRPETEIKLLRDRLCNLEKRSLLFLRNLRMVQWYNENNGQKGTYSCHRHQHDKIQNASKVDLGASINSENQQSEEFLVFRKEVQPPQEVLNELEHLAEDDGERERIQRSAEKLQPIEVAFKLHDGRITTMDNCVLFSYLPTEKETHLRFLIQARYQTTLPRDNIVKMEDNLWNKWLIKETADFLPEVLEQLKIGGLLQPTFFDILPLETDPVPEAFNPIVKRLREAMRNLPFVPTQGGKYAKAKNVLYPHDELLRELTESTWLCSNSSWLDPEIQDKEESRRRFTVMQEAGVETVEITDILSWLEKQDVEWFEGRCNEWLLTLYTYLKKHQSRLERIKKLTLVRLENGKHVSASDELVFFPPDTDEEREEIAPFLGELPIVKSTILEGEERDNIETFFKKLGVKPLRPGEIVDKWIIPQYSQPEKPSVAQNLIHMRYLLKVWDEISDSERKNLKEKIFETPILYAHIGMQKENFDFVKPCEVYLPTVYTDNDDLENYFSASDGEIWFIDDAYLDNDSDQKTWLKFLKMIGTMDTPKVIEKSLSVDYQNRQELDKRGLKYETRSSNYEHTIKDFYLQSLSEVLTEISESRKENLSKALWYLLIKALPSGKYDRDNFFKGTYNWVYYNDKCLSFDSIFYCELKKNAWLPDEQGNLHCPSECFAPTSENKKVLGDSVAYLHTDFDISEDNETARWLAEKFGVHLNADTDSVMKYLKDLSSNSSTVSVEDIEPMYRFLDRQDARRKEEFETKPLIFTPEPEPCWWQSDKVFWEDENAVFGNDRGYLKNHYTETLKSFFIVSGVSERAALLDYVRGIQDVTTTKNAEDKEVRKRVKILYGRLWTYLQEGGSFLEDEEWQEKWKEIREGKCWLGKKGGEWDFFYKNKLVWNDNNYFADIFEGKIPFWAFDDALLELAKHLGIEGCYQVSDVEFDYYGNQGKYESWSEKMQKLSPYIYDFLNSMPQHEEHEKKKSAKVLDRLMVCRTQKLEVKYKLKGISVSDPNPRQSFLDTTNQEITLWLGTEVDESTYSDIIGDTLQDYFGISELREFTKDLLPTIEPSKSILLSWERRGFQANLCLCPPETESKEGEENSTELIHEKLPEETSSELNVPEMIESKVETPIPHEVPENNNRDGNPAEDVYETHQYIPNTSQTRQSGGHWKNTSGGGNGAGGHGGRGGSGPGEKHENLKNALAENPSQLGEGLELVKMEYKFISMDSADILFKDKSGNPVTVEVESYISQGNYVGLWQAVKYKHLAAVEYGLPCDQVRSILAAPDIPDDVKEKCRELGIDPIEVSMPKRKKNTNAQSD